MKELSYNVFCKTSTIPRVKNVSITKQALSTIRIQCCEGAPSGYLGSQDTFYVGNLKCVGRIYQQTFVDTYSKVAFAKLYTTKTPITAADVLNNGGTAKRSRRLDRIL